MDEHPSAPQPATTGPVACYRHPGRVTRLSCSSCDRPICVDCTNPAAVGQKCPECAAPTGRSTVITSRDLQQQSALAGSPVVIGILALSIGIAVLELVLPAAWLEIFVRFADDVRSVEAGEWWRTITAATLHSSTFIWHIAFNMYALVLFGPTVEKRAGSVPFLLFYLASAAAGGLAFQAFRDVGTATGASGAVFGLFGLHVTAAVLARNTAAGRAGLRQLGPLLAINLALPLFVPRIAWEAHVGGLLAGALIMFLWSRIAPLGQIRAADASGPSPTVKRSLVAGAVLIASVLALPLV